MPRTSARLSAGRTSMTSPLRPLSRPVSTTTFLTRPRGAASLTDTTMTSPIVAYFRLEPPSTLMHMTRRAPELSATSRLVCIWIIGALLLRRGLGSLGLARAPPRRGFLLDRGLRLNGDRGLRRGLGL